MNKRINIDIINLENRINSSHIQNELTKIGLQSGVIVGAIPDLINRAHNQLTCDHNFKIIGRNGESLETWLKVTREIAPHLWGKDS